MTLESGVSGESMSESEVDAQFRALADVQRRRLLEFLIEEHPESVARTTAVAHVASTTEEAYERVELKTSHQHLPQLEDTGLVSYDPEDGHLSYTGGELVEDVLDLL